MNVGNHISGPARVAVVDAAARAGIVGRQVVWVGSGICSTPLISIFNRGDTRGHLTPPTRIIHGIAA